MGDDAAAALVSCLGFLVGLEQLDLSHNGIEEDSVVALAHCLSSLTALSSLCMGGNDDFGEAGMAALALCRGVSLAD